MSEELWPWDFVVLQPLSDGKPMHLKGIYAAIKERRGKGGINEKLFKVDGRWGDRQDYTHIVRSTISHAVTEGYVKHLGTGRTGRYQITDKGQEYLAKIQL